MRSKLMVIALGVGLLFVVRPVDSQEASLAERLEALRVQATLPAVAGATFSSADVSPVSAVGVRRLGDDTPVSPGDLWHIGSITKSFTSLLVGKYVDRGELSWSSTLADLIGENRAGQFKGVTMSQLLSHRAGLPANVPPAAVKIAAADGASVGVQRQRLMDTVLATEPASAPGASFVYSNLGYIVVGAVLESRMKKTWEVLVQEEVLAPLNLASAGFGAPGSREILSQPRGHVRGAAGALTPMEPSGVADNPPYLGPAGRLHMTIADLARWGQAHLRGERGQDGIVRAATFKRLHQPEGTYAMGWVSQATADGRVVWHNGSNTMWYAIVAFAPDTDRGVVIITNGSIGAAQAVDAAAMAIVRGK